MSPASITNHTWHGNQPDRRLQNGVLCRFVIRKTGLSVECR